MCESKENKKVLVCGSVGLGLEAARLIAEHNLESEIELIITPDDITERGINMIQKTPMFNAPQAYRHQLTQPLTRAERRKKARKKNRK